MDAIVYTSNSGFTYEYASILGSKLNLKVYSLNEAIKTLNSSSDIIYLGWIMAGQIKGFKKAFKLYNVKAVCGVGMGKTGSQIEDCKKANNLPDNIMFVTLQGGFDIKKLHGIYKFMMNFMKNTVGKKLTNKPDKTDEEKDMLDLLSNGGSRVKEENLNLILDWYENTYMKSIK